MLRVVLLSTCLACPVAASAADSCERASTRLTQPERKMYARSISSNLTKWQAPAQIKIEKALTIANWTAIWATPSGAEPGIFFYSQEKSGLVYHDVWGGHADPSETTDVSKWIRELAPSVPSDFAGCVANTITSGR